MTVNKEIVTAWVRALRSGEYEQGQGQLRDFEDRFCCLGVLCDLAVKAGVDVKVEEGDSAYSYDSSSDFPPRVVRDWIGVDVSAPFYEKPETGTCDSEGCDCSSDRNTLAELNDDGMSFEQIAEVIEGKWLNGTE